MSTFSSQAGVPQAQIRELDGKTHLYGFRYFLLFVVEVLANLVEIAKRAITCSVPRQRSN